MIAHDNTTDSFTFTAFVLYSNNVPNGILIWLRLLFAVHISVY